MLQDTAAQVSNKRVLTKDTWYALDDKRPALHHDEASAAKVRSQSIRALGRRAVRRWGGGPRLADTPGEIPCRSKSWWLAVPKTKADQVNSVCAKEESLASLGKK